MAHFSLALLAFIFLVATRATTAYDGSITLLQFNDLDGEYSFEFEFGSRTAD